MRRFWKNLSLLLCSRLPGAPSIETDGDHCQVPAIVPRPVVDCITGDGSTDHYLPLRWSTGDVGVFVAMPYVPSVRDY